MNLKPVLAAFVAALSLISCNSGTKGDWTPAGDRIMTTWGENLDPASVLQEYPRPQMIREKWINLNGLWEYAVTPVEEEPERMDGNILVPFAVESALSGVGRVVTENDALWYERNFEVPEDWAGQRIMLNFGAVDWKAEVFVDEQFAGSHTGGYAPFGLDITDLLSKKDRHVLRVKVTDRTDKWFQPRGKQVSEPGGIWYTAVTGIWQTVWMEPVPSSHINSYFAVADIEGGVLDVTLDADLCEGDVCEVVLLDDGKILRYRKMMEADQNNASFTSVPAVSPKRLYALSSESYQSGFYYKPRIDKELLSRHTEGVICLSGCLQGELSQLLLSGDEKTAEQVAREYRELFSDL